MHSYYKENNKLNPPSSNIPKLMIPPRTRANYYSSPENIIKYLRSSSLAGSGSSSSGKSSFRSSVSPHSEKTPVKVVEEDVLVMDGVLVASDTNIVGSGSSSSSAGVGFYKTEVCRAWEEFGHCRYGSRCQVCLHCCIMLYAWIPWHVNVFWNNVLLISLSLFLNVRSLAVWIFLIQNVNILFWL